MSRHTPPTATLSPEAQVWMSLWDELTESRRVRTKELTGGGVGTNEAILEAERRVDVANRAIRDFLQTHGQTSQLDAEIRRFKSRTA